MSQAPLTNDERIAALRRFGYDPREAEFLCLAALHGGHFLPRQYQDFLGHSHVAASLDQVPNSSARARALSQMVARLFENGHAKALVYRRDQPIYHLATRPFYAVIGQPDNRDRRERQPSTIKNKLMGFDFVVANPEARFLATEQEKVDYFSVAYGVPIERLPAKVYGGSGATTRRYFVEKYPILLPHVSGDNGSASGARGPVSFCFVDEGLTTASHFETFLKHYAPLLSALSSVRLIYIAARPAPFRRAEKAFARLLGNRLFSVQVDSNLTHDKLRYFDLRKRFEAKEFESLNRAALLELRDARATFSAMEYEQEYGDWKVGATEKQTLFATEKCGCPETEIAFLTHLLEHNYDLFGTLTAL